MFFVFIFIAHWTCYFLFLFLFLYLYLHLKTQTVSNVFRMHVPSFSRFADGWDGRVNV